MKILDTALLIVKWKLMVLSILENKKMISKKRVYQNTSSKMDQQISNLVNACVRSNGSDFDMAHLLYVMYKDYQRGDRNTIRSLSKFLSTHVYNAFVQQAEKEGDNNIYVKALNDIALRLKNTEFKSRVINEYNIVFKGAATIEPLRFRNPFKKSHV
jgi:hypothetical protein